MREVQIERVQPGDVVLMYGHRYVVKVNHFDPYGNTGTQPRHVLVADVPDADPSIFTRDMTIGRTVGTLVTIEDAS